MSQLAIELIGVAATMFVLLSMCFKTTTIKGSIIMRFLNLIGSIIFVVYGLILPAISTAILNVALFLVNSYHLFNLLKELKKK